MRDEPADVHRSFSNTFVSRRDAMPCAAAIQRDEHADTEPHCTEEAVEATNAPAHAWVGIGVEGEKVKPCYVGARSRSRAPPQYTATFASD
jgi:hypothetical protein